RSVSFPPPSRSSPAIASSSPRSTHTSPLTRPTPEPVALSSAIDLARHERKLDLIEQNSGRKRFLGPRVPRRLGPATRDREAYKRRWPTKRAQSPQATGSWGPVATSGD